MKTDEKSAGEVVVLAAKGNPSLAPTLERLQSVEHPNLAPVMEIKIEDDEIRLVQPRPDGRPLPEIVKDEPIPVGRALRITAQIAAALAAAHRQGLVHGNVVPSSVFVSDTGGVQLLGVGLGNFEGQPHYYSPEKAQQLPLDPRSDVFSLGSILYFLLTGFQPFVGENREEVIKSVVYGPPPRMSVIRPDLPGKVERLVLRCLAKTPSDRYPSADHLIDALMRLTLEAGSEIQPRARVRASRLALDAALLTIAVAVGVYLGFNVPRAPLPADAGPYVGWKRIAVMEPRFLGKDPGRRYLTQGIVDEIVSAVSANTSLEVISTLSTRIYNESSKPAQVIARELLADGLIESTLYDEPSGVTLHLRLSDARTGAYVWNHRLDLTNSDLFRIQEKVEGVLYAELAAIWLSTRAHLQRAGTIEAYSLFLEGRQLFNHYSAEDNRKAIDKFQRALEKDADFAPAWAALARAYRNVVSFEQDLEPRWLEKAHQAAETAIDIAPNLPDGYEARASIGFTKYLFFGVGERTRIERDIERALQLSPDYPDGLLTKAFLLLSMGMDLDDQKLIDQSLPLFQRALTLQPNLANPETNYAYALAFSGQSRAALDRLEELVKRQPESLVASDALSTVRFLTGNPAGAIESTLESIQRLPDSAVHWLRLAAFYAAAGDEANASKILVRMRTAREAAAEFFAASALAGLGRDKEALVKLQSWKLAIQKRREHFGPFRWWLKNDPNFDRLRSQGLLDCCPPQDTKKSG